LSISTCEVFDLIPYYFHPKSTVLVARAKVRSAFIYLQGVLRRFPDRYQQQSARRFTPAQDIKLRPQIPPPNTATYLTKVTTANLHLCTPFTLTHTQKKTKGLQTFREQLKTSWVPIHPLYDQDLDRSTGSHILESSDWLPGS
jgi:hypothetical protein